MISQWDMVSKKGNVTLKKKVIGKQEIKNQRIKTKAVHRKQYQTLNRHSKRHR